jgi:hypothetical protein
LSDDFDLRVISLGAGVQSSTLYRMAALGEIPGPRPTHAIFADTQVEPPWVNEQLDQLEADHGDVIPIIRATAGNLGEDWFRGQESTVSDERAMGAAIPVHLRMPDGSKGMASRTCTQRYKITPILRATRQLLGLEPGERAAGRYRVESWIGISLDEVQRVKDSRESWITNRHPLVFDVPMRRNDCLRWLEQRGFPIARRSACVFCPYRSNAEWRDLKTSPEAWQQAVAFDRRLRNESRYVSSRGDAEKAQLRGTPYLHSSRVPLDEASLFNHDEKQIDLFDNECEGMCGI